MILNLSGGSFGPYDIKILEKNTHPTAIADDGGTVWNFAQNDAMHYASMRYAHTPEAFTEEIKALFLQRMAEVNGKILPCDSYYLASKIQNEIGMKTFMPEVGCQIPLMRIEVALARGTAKANKKTWGTYYECWREIRENGESYYCSPCFNNAEINEWYAKQEHCEDNFSQYGANGGSSRLLQNRIYYYALMAGADYFSEEWGLNCSYSDMEEFTLSDYGTVKKDFINAALDLRGMKAVVPFAIVLPKKYSCIEIQDMFEPYELGDHRDEYMRCKLSDEDKAYCGHIEDVLKLIYAQTDKVGNEGHVITNSRFPDVFDIIYEDESDEVLSGYKYLIDASKDDDFIKQNRGLKILSSKNLDKLERELSSLIKETMPCYADGLCYLVSEDEGGDRYLTIFNNEGNERSLEKGDIIHSQADKTVNIIFKEPSDIKVIKEGRGKINIEKKDDYTYCVKVPAAGFVILKF